MLQLIYSDILIQIFIGLATGAYLSDFGLKVACVDINKEKIENLKKGILQIIEVYIYSCKTMKRR